MLKTLALKYGQVFFIEYLLVLVHCLVYKKPLLEIESLYSSVGINSLNSSL